MSTQIAEGTALFSSEELERIRAREIPQHIAIIPDGNRRWAQKAMEQSRTQGHAEGADSLIQVVRAAQELGVKTVTIYGFSTENAMRSEEEVRMLVSIIEGNLRRQVGKMLEYNVKFDTIGDLHRLPTSLREAIQQTKDATAHCTDINFNLALGYGSRDELCRAIKGMMRDGVSPEAVNEDLIDTYLDTKKWPDPDLLIRTSGELRVSNFLLWQLSYAEIYVTNTLWPDFGPKGLYEAVLSYQQRERRVGT